MTFLVPPTPIAATTGQRDANPAAALCLERAGARSWRVCNSRVARGQGRFLAFIDEKDDEFEVMELADDFVWTTFHSMSDAFAHVARTNGELQAAEPKAWIR